MLTYADVCCTYAAGAERAAGDDTRASSALRQRSGGGDWRRRAAYRLSQKLASLGGQGAGAGARAHTELLYASYVPHTSVKRRAGGDMRLYIDILLYMCPHTTMCVSSYYYMCVLILLYVCPHTTDALVSARIPS
jgi:hypothetical protein